MFWQNEEFGSGLGAEIRLDGVVCLVDAVFGLQVRAIVFRTHLNTHLTLIF
jgi:hypothetical protein